MSEDGRWKMEDGRWKMEDGTADSLVGRMNPAEGTRQKDPGRRNPAGAAQKSRFEDSYGLQPVGYNACNQAIPTISRFALKMTFLYNSQKLRFLVLQLLLSLEMKIVNEMLQ